MPCAHRSRTKRVQGLRLATVIATLTSERHATECQIGSERGLRTKRDSRESPAFQDTLRSVQARYGRGESRLIL